ncbi:Pseudomurein-binding repeat protein [Pelomyxa schiedti]|nr:Pseudomurein-binding repeat protein [Pelomyxa schiedti]
MTLTTACYLVLLTAVTIVCGSTVVNVVIYSGDDAAYNSYEGIAYCLDYSNNYNLTPGVVFKHAYSTKITSTILSSYDVVAMPGGTSGYSYLHNSNIDGAAIQSFVGTKGKGYYGTCAGAYSACSVTVDYYTGWGVAPNVVCNAVDYVGDTNVLMTDAGTEILGFSGDVTLYHVNGPAMSGGTALATYDDDNTGFEGYEAMVTDVYGNGRTVLSGPHPELEEHRHCQMVSHMAAWAAKLL